MERHSALYCIWQAVELLEDPKILYTLKKKKGKKRDKVIEEKFSMAMKYKFTFVLPHPELQDTGDWETILQVVCLHLCPFPTLFPCHLLLAMPEKILGFYQLLDYPSTAVLPLTNGISAM